MLQISDILRELHMHMFPLNFRIYSGGNDWCVMARDVETDPKHGGPTAVFLHDAPVYGIDASPEGPGG